MSQKQTSASRQHKTPVATPDRLHLLQDASWNLSAISYCIASIGRDLSGKPNNPGAMDAAGQALEWLSGEMERRCAAIAEASS
ncbi:hypothetical protein APT_00795 [Acetobacter pasteurianus NBRC 101655]|uniref:hypothetical protein n=1 Tax=Acetobacter pasteurianus TaxID=438 RepID=UPI000245734F|nr:hypothetical protein [Acetobacter pasteurianus]BAU37877.1 hypothetical protein APT_00795 [Acetobacter pasteurianus NBRC 101655]